METKKKPVKKAKAPTPKWQAKKDNRNLRCNLSTEEIAAYSTENAETVQQIERLEESKKASASQYKADIDERLAKSRRLSGYVVNKWQEREVECVWHYEVDGLDSKGKMVPHPDKKTLIRTDTGAVVEIRPITDQERQMSLPLEPETETPTPAAKKKGKKNKNHIVEPPQLMAPGDSKANPAD